MTDLEFESLKDGVRRTFEGKLRILNVGKANDDGMTLIPLEDENLFTTPKLSLERIEYSSGAMYSLWMTDNRRGVGETMAFTYTSEFDAWQAVKMAVACLFGVEGKEGYYTEEEVDAEEAY